MQECRILAHHFGLIENMTNAQRTLVLLAGITVSWTMLGGCSSEKQVSYRSGDMTHTISEGKEAVPKDFPVPIYPKSTTTGSVSAQTDALDENAQFLMLTSDDPYDKIGQFYEQEFKAKGWKVENVQSLPKLVSIAATKDELDANVMLSSDGKKTNISIAVSKNSDKDPIVPDSTQVYTPNQLTPPTD
jgi:hypothetical protein